MLGSACAVTREIIAQTGQQPYVPADMYDYGIYMWLRFMTGATDRPCISYDITKRIFQGFQRSARVDFAIPSKDRDLPKAAHSDSILHLFRISPVRIFYIFALYCTRYITLGKNRVVEMMSLGIVNQCQSPLTNAVAPKGPDNQLEWRVKKMPHRFKVTSLFIIVLLLLSACKTDQAEPTVVDTPTVTSMPEDVTPTVPPPTEQPETAVPTVQPIEAQLRQALDERDFARMQALIDGTFMLAPWRSQGTAYSPEQAIEQLRNNYLGLDTTLVFDPDKDLMALLGGMDPLSILGPDVVEPSALFVSGWGMEGNDEAILYLAHRADGSLYWYGVLFSSGGFAPAVSNEVLGTELPLAIPEVGIAIGLPEDHVLLKNTELFRRGSYASYDVVMSEEPSYPYLAEIQFFNRESIEGFLSRCANTEYPCFFGDYPDVERYEGQKAAYARLQDYEHFSLQEIGDRHFFVSQHPCQGVPCVVREYTTFTGDTKVDVWVMMADATADQSQASAADALVEKLSVQDDYAGIGAIPGPLYTLLVPGVTLRYPLGWTVREETTDEPAFVTHSVSFVPPAFAGSDQPQVPAINLFVYAPPLTDTLQTWLEVFGTEAPFGSGADAAGAGPEFFGVRDSKEIRAASFLGLQFNYDVLGFTARQLLFAVGQTVVGLSYVDFGPEDLGPAYVQMQSSLAAKNVTPPTFETEVQYVIALMDVRMRRGPGVTFPQIGQVADGQIALVTGASEDREWWRVMCPNDTIGDCWVSADPQLTQPTTPPGVGPEPSGSSSWIEYRDERYGYGLALPCHWIISPAPLEGDYATLTLRSYDDGFFTANSIKGQWKDGQWPGGALKMDVTVVEGLASDQSLADALTELLERNEDAVLQSVEEVAVGVHPAVKAVMASSNDPIERHSTVALRLALDKMLLVSVLPEEAWEWGDARGLLNAIALSPEQDVAVPGYAPGAPIITVPEGCTG